LTEQKSFSIGLHSQLAPARLRAACLGRNRQ
jgi:hypothetical protein